MIELKLENADKVLKKLSELPDKVIEKALDGWIEKHLEEGSEAIEKALRRLPGREKTEKPEPDREEKQAPKREKGEF